jgi:hypothetical protein
VHVGEILSSVAFWHKNLLSKLQCCFVALAISKLERIALSKVGKS